MQIVIYVALFVGTFVLSILKRPGGSIISFVTAGALVLVFSNLDKISEFKAPGFDIKMFDQMKAVLAKETEPPIHAHINDNENPDVEDIVIVTGLVGDEASKVIKALLNSNYTWRNIGGISTESGVSREKVLKSLDWLTKNNLASSSQDENGTIWALTQKGRDKFSNLSK